MKRNRSIPANNRGYYFFVTPTKSSEVVAAEDCRVIQVIKLNSEYMVFTQGKYKITYAELTSSYVVQDQNLKKGDKIGAVPKMRSKNEYLSNFISLMISIQDSSDDYIMDYGLFGK